MESPFVEAERRAKEKAGRLDVTALPMNMILKGCKPNLVVQTHVEEALRRELGDMGQNVTLLEYIVDQAVYFETYRSNGTGDTGTSSITLVKAWYYFHIPLVR